MMMPMMTPEKTAAQAVIDEINSERDWDRIDQYLIEVYGSASIYFIAGQYFADYEGLDLPFCGFAGPCASLAEIKEEISVFEAEEYCVDSNYSYYA